MDVFHIPSQQVAIDHIHQVLDRQEQALAPIFVKVVDNVDAHLDAQEAMVGAVQRKLHRALTNSLNRQERMVDKVAASMVNAAGQSIQTQQMAVDALQARMPPPPQVYNLVCCPDGTLKVVTDAEFRLLGPSCRLLGKFPNILTAQNALTAARLRGECKTTQQSGPCMVTLGGCWQGMMWPAALKVTASAVEAGHSIAVVPPNPTTDVWDMTGASCGGQGPVFCTGFLFKVLDPQIEGNLKIAIRCNPNPPARWNVGAEGFWPVYQNVFGGEDFPLSPNGEVNLPFTATFTLASTFTGQAAPVTISITVDRGNPMDLQLDQQQTYQKLCAGGGGGGGNGHIGNGNGGGGGNGGKCPPGPVCCPPPDVAPPPAVVDQGKPDCDRIVGTATDRIPIPGSADWCANEPAIRAAVVSAANTILDAFLSWTGMSTWLEEKQPGMQFEWLISARALGSGIANDLLNLLKIAGVDLRNYLNNLLCWWKDAAAMTPGCNAKEVVALAVMKAVIEWMEHVRIGTDAIVWLTVDLHIRLPQMIRVIEYLQASSCPVEIPHPGEAMEAYLQGQITTEVYTCWLGDHGWNADVVEPILLSRAEKLHVKEVIEWGRRNDRPDAQIRGDLLDRGWLREPDLTRRMELYDELPTIGDHLHWLSRNVDDGDYVKKYALMDGFDTQDQIQTLPGLGGYLVQTDTHGRNFWHAFGHDLRARGMKREYAALHYAAHWVQPAPTQMQEFVYRLRPGRVPFDRQFTTDDYQRILTEQNYAPKALRWLADTVYRVLAPGSLLALYRNMVLTTDQLVSGYQDFGYDLPTAQSLAANDDIIRARMRASETHGYTPASLGQLYRAGLMTDAEADQRMSMLGYTEAESQTMRDRAVLDYTRNVQDSTTQLARRRLIQSLMSAYTSGIVDQRTVLQSLVAAGFRNDAATVVVQSIDMSAKTVMMNKLVATMRRAYLRGELSDLEVQTYLAGAGIVPQRVTEYLTVWQIERQGERAQASAAQILRWFVEGLIPQAIAAGRLRNLGWQDPDIILLLQEAGMKPNPFEKMKLSEQRRLIADLKRQQPLSMLRKLYEDGKIDRAAVARQLDLYGYAQVSIDRYLMLWDQEVADKLAKDAAKQAKETVSAARGNISLPWVQKLAKGKVIDERTAEAILTADGYDKQAVADYLALFFA